MGSVIGNIICLFSTKGGVGRTTLAGNLAISLSQLGHKVCVIDFDLGAGGLDQILGLTPEKTIANLVHDDDPDNVGNYLTPFSDNLSLLAAPARPELSLTLDSTLARAILSNLKQSFDFIVVDMPATFESHVLATLEMSDFVGLLVENDILSAKAAVFALQNLALLGYQLQTMHVIVNKFSWRGLSLDEIKEALGIPIFWRVDRDKVLVNSVDNAKPFVIDKPKAAVTVSLNRLALALSIEFGKMRTRR